MLASGPLAPAVAATPRYAAMAIDANTGTVLHNQAGDAKRYPASLTKMMTLYLTFELIELGRLDYATKIKMTEEGAAASPSKLGLKPGEEITVLDAIKILVTKSANDVAIALAQHIGGTEANFARLMTRKAHQIGMKSTTFMNASGLPNDEQVTTARDMLTLALRLQDEFPKHYKLFATRSFTYGGKTYRNHNALLTRYQGMDGIKTGYTRASGFNLVSSVHRNGKHVVAAVFGGKTSRIRNARMVSVLDKAIAKASVRITRKPAVFTRAPKPVAAQPPPPRPAPPVQTAAVAPRANPPPVVSAASASPSIAVAKVRRILLGPDLDTKSAPSQPRLPRRLSRCSLLQTTTLPQGCRNLHVACRPPRCRRRLPRSMTPRPRRRTHPRSARPHARRQARSRSRSALTAIQPTPSSTWTSPASAPAACSTPITRSPSRSARAPASSTVRVSAASMPQRPPPRACSCGG